MEATGAESLRPDDPPAVGAYRLLGRLGEGGMGTVYLAVAPTGRLVAVKIVKAEYALDDDFAQRFHTEVTNARKVASFCTAQVLDNGNADDGRPYMVTEYISGIPLSRQIARYGPLEPGPLHGVALGTAAALAAIHVAGLVHRDLKPANVILSLTGPRVIDFGISRALDATRRVTQAGQLLGSPGWWAPEQVRGQEVTPAADIFTWGCLIAYAGSGRPPFGRGDVVTLATRVLSGRPDLGVLPAPLGELAARATDPDPARRPNAQDLLIALVSGVMPESTPPTLVATEVLTRSWEPPSNIATDTGTADISVDSAVPSSLPREISTANSSAAVSASEVSTAAPVQSGAREASTVPPGGGEPERSVKSRWLLAAAAVVAALTVTTVILTKAGPWGQTGGTDQPTATAGTPSPSPGPDIGRRFRLAGYDVQLLVPRPARCGLRAYGNATTSRGQLCVIGWTLLNLGGDEATIRTSPARLFDDQGGERSPERHSTRLPTTIAPGSRADGVLIFDLPPGRTASRLLIGQNVEVMV